MFIASPAAPTRMRNAFALLMLISSLAVFSSVAQSGTQGTEAPLDLNRATSEQLEALPGIGEVKAAAILAVRDARGGFRSMEELEAVRGIGPALVAKLRPLLKVQPSVTKGPESARTAKK